MELKHWEINWQHWKKCYAFKTALPHLQRNQTMHKKNAEHTK